MKKRNLKIGLVSLVVASSLCGASFTSGATADGSGLDAVAINYIAELDKNTHFQLGSSLNSSSRGLKAGVSFGW